MRVYIATRLENHKQHNVLRDELLLRGIALSYDWTTHGPVYKDGKERIKEVAQLEANGVFDADLVVALWPGGRGTHVEIGIAIGAGKRVLFWSPEPKKHYEATQDICAFYLHPLVKCSVAKSMGQLAYEAAHILFPNAEETK